MSPLSRLMRHCLPAALSLLVLAACTGTGGAKPEPAPPRTLDVVTLNIYHDKADWPKRLPLIVAQLRALDPDIIALQEVLQTEALHNQAQTIAAELGYTVQFVSTDPADQAHRYGNALLTRLPVKAQDWHRLQPHDDSRSIGHARLDIDGHPLDVYFTHLHWTLEGGAIREVQVADALDFVARTSGDVPSLILGDFNSPASAPEFAALRARYIDAYGARHPEADGAGVTTLNPHFFDYRSRIDLVFAQQGRFEIEDAQVVLDTPDAEGTWPSDHFGTWVRLRLRP